MTLPCSDAARERGDPLTGTAPPARRWLLVEQRQGWGRVALDSLIAPGLDRAALVTALAAASARLQLIRRPAGRRAPTTTTDAAGDHDGARRWAVIGTDPSPGERWGTLTEGWPAILTALTGPLPEPAGEPTVLVCTNGRHDACCAVRGRPVAAALAARYPAAVWETTHTGGDRFAANLLVLPDGACYGHVDPETAPALVAAHLRGEPDLAHLRGITGRSPQDQAALLAVAPRVGVLPWDRGRLTTRPRRTDHARPQGWSRDVSLDGTLVAVVHGHNTIRPAEFLTCSAVAPSRAAVPTVVEVVDSPRRPR